MCTKHNERHSFEREVRQTRVQLQRVRDNICKQMIRRSRCSPLGVADRFLENVVASFEIHDAILEVELPLVTTPRDLRSEINAHRYKRMLRIMRHVIANLVILTHDHVIGVEKLARVFVTDVVARIQWLLLDKSPSIASAASEYLPLTMSGAY